MGDFHSDSSGELGEVAYERDLARDVWREAMRRLGNRRSQRAYVGEIALPIAQSLGVSDGAVVPILLAGRDGIVVRGRLLSPTDSMSARFALRANLGERLITPAGNPRKGPVAVAVVGERNGRALFEMRVLMVEGLMPFWVCAHLRVADAWARLWRDAEALGQRWELPLRSASEDPCCRTHRLMMVATWLLGTG